MKASVGARLDATKLLDPGHLAKLQALSVTTVEELFGLINASPSLVQGFLEIHDLARLQADAAPYTQGSMLSRLASATEELKKSPYALGAVPPATVAVEEVATAATFDEYASQQELAFVPADGDEASLMDCFGPIRHQGNRGTCVAHAVCAALECAWHDKPRVEDLSEQFLYCVSKQNDGSPQESGTFVHVAVQRATIDGVCVEATWPYVPETIPGNESQAPADQSAIDDAAGRLATTSNELPYRSPGVLREAIRSGTPVALSVPVYDNWASNPATALYGFIPMPLPGSVLKGGHAMCAMGFGFDDDFTGGGYFVLRNSWGTDWASRSPVRPGYGVIPFEYINRYAWEAFTVS